MTKATIIVAVLAITVIAGCNSAVWGNLAVMAVGIGIFIGTLSLGGPAANGDSASSRGRSNRGSESIESHPDHKEPKLRA